MSKKRIYLSPPRANEATENQLISGYRSGWITTMGPQVDDFALQLKERFHFQNVTLLNSGTSALHLAVRLCGVQDGDKVIVSNASFCAVANAVLYQRGEPILLDETNKGGLDPEEVSACIHREGSRIKAVIAVHQYGRPCQIQELRSICDQYSVPLIEDAAGALGSKVGGTFCGNWGDYSIVSFNGNKLLTTGGGGALICKDPTNAEKARYLAGQAKTLGKNHYWHRDVGYNYLMSNISAAVGLGEVRQFEMMMGRRKWVYSGYWERFKKTGFIDELPIVNDSEPNHWLSVFLIKEEYSSRIDWDQLILFFNEQDIEVRRFWTPLHLQPAYSNFEHGSVETSIDFFERGICLPSGFELGEGEIDMVSKLLTEYLHAIAQETS